jgi:TRAP-type C4-dicarboxylate transport system permease large subunit
LPVLSLPYTLRYRMAYDSKLVGDVYCNGILVAPPVDMNVFIVKNITKAPISTIYQGVYPFLISMILLIALLFAFPEIVLYLPRTLME